MGSELPSGAVIDEASLPGAMHVGGIRARAADEPGRTKTPEIGKMIGRTGGGGDGGGDGGGTRALLSTHW
eukprot:5858517-Pleurochrysis_carterae.AAC.1